MFKKIFTIFFVKYVYLAIICTFELESLICVIALTSVVFIVDRAIARIDAASIYSNSIIVLIKSALLNKQPIYIDLLEIAIDIASIVSSFLEKIFA